VASLSERAAAGRVDARVSESSRAQGREAEFERLVLPYRTAMMRAIWRVLHDPELAEEALQESLATLWRKLPAVSRHPNPAALVLRISFQAACDQLRALRRRRGRFVPLDEATGAAAARPGDRVEDRERRGEILEAISRLRRRQATAFLMRAVHGEPYAAIAEALGCSEATARVHVMRAREKLRRALGTPGSPPREEESQ
jgi:RNA polymerase sigma factor (sigma-70 family)